MKITFLESLVISVAGMLIVFAVLVLLMFLIQVMSAIIRAATGKSREEKEMPEKAPPARGSCGEISLFHVPDKTAAMIMAIVAEQLDAPLSELRFLSIKEVEADEI